jgi:diaminopimelate epimerase
MKYTFYKYQGTGNDFIIIDNRQDVFGKNNTKLVAELCDRRFGIGADGLILLEDHNTADFKMVYYNSDGNQSTMCGNGGRCIVAFAHDIGLIVETTSFEAIDGFHKAKYNQGRVALHMQDVSSLDQFTHHTVLDTGSPHYVCFNNKLDSLDIKKEGAKIRYSDTFVEEGINVNFVQKLSDTNFKVRTYERGVEDETFSCGTGVTAVALAMHSLGETEDNQVQLVTKGGNLEVTYVKKGNGYTNIWLIGPATFVFKGEVEW